MRSDCDLRKRRAVRRSALRSPSVRYTLVFRMVHLRGGTKPLRGGRASSKKRAAGLFSSGRAPYVGHTLPLRCDLRFPKLPYVGHPTQGEGQGTFGRGLVVLGPWSLAAMDARATPRRGIMPGADIPSSGPQPASSRTRGGRAANPMSCSSPEAARSTVD